MIEHIRAAKRALYGALREAPKDNLKLIHDTERAIIAVEMIEADLLLAKILKEEKP